MKISVLITSYNPDFKTLNELITSIQPYIDSIVVVDNSEDSIDIENYINGNITIIKNHNHNGISGALNLGIKELLCYNSNWILFLDQDSVLVDGSLTRIIETISIVDSDIGIVSTNAFYSESKKKLINCSSSGLIDVDTVITSGSIISSDCIKKVGLFNERYFIEFVDIEYCSRVKNKGFRISVFCKPQLIAQFGNTTNVNIFGRTVFLDNHEPWRHYYRSRNFMYLFTSKYVRKNRFNLFKNFIKASVITLTFESSRGVKMSALLLGIMHAIFGISLKHKTVIHRFG